MKEIVHGSRAEYRFHSWERYAIPVLLLPLGAFLVAASVKSMLDPGTSTEHGQWVFLFVVMPLLGALILAGCLASILRRRTIWIDGDAGRIVLSKRFLWRRSDLVVSARRLHSVHVVRRAYGKEIRYVVQMTLDEGFIEPFEEYFGAGRDRDYMPVRRRAMSIARLLDLDFEDASLGSPERIEAAELGVGLIERLRSGEGAPEWPAPLDGSRLIHAEAGEYTVIQLPRRFRGKRYLRNLVAATAVVGLSCLAGAWRMIETEYERGREERAAAGGEVGLPFADRPWAPALAFLPAALIALVGGAMGGMRDRVVVSSNGLEIREPFPFWTRKWTASAEELTSLRIVESSPKELTPGGFGADEAILVESTRSQKLFATSLSPAERIWLRDAILGVLATEPPSRA